MVENRSLGGFLQKFEESVFFEQADQEQCMNVGGINMFYVQMIY